MKDPATFDAPIPMGIRATPRGDQFPVVQRTFRAQLGGVVMRVAKDIADLHRQLLQQLGGDQIVGVTGDGALRGQGDPDAPDHDRQMPLPAVPPAMIARLTPGGFGVNRAMRDFPGQPMFLVPNAAIGAPGRTVDGGRMALWPPGCTSVTRWRPRHPISAGSRAGSFSKRRSQVRRVGKRPCSVSRGRSCCATGSSCSRK